MKLPGKDFLKKAFLGVAASLTLAGCAIVPYEPAYPEYYPPRHRVIVEPLLVLPAPIIVVPGHYHGHDRHHHGRGWRR